MSLITEIDYLKVIKELDKMLLISEVDIDEEFETELSFYLKYDRHAEPSIFLTGGFLIWCESMDYDYGTNEEIIIKSNEDLITFCKVKYNYLVTELMKAYTNVN